LFEELEELVLNAGTDYANFCAEKTAIKNQQNDHKDEINDNVVNKWMFISLLKAYTSSGLYTAIGSKFGKGQYGSAKCYLKILMRNLRYFGQEY